MANSDGNYKAVLNGRYQGQAIVNVLYYRLAFDLVPGSLNFAGAEDLAFQIKQEIWTNTMRAKMPNGYLLENITVYPYDSQFDLLFQLPYVENVNQSGTAGTGPTNGPAPCLIFRFNLAPTSPLNGIYPPRGGYLAIGPVGDSAIGDDGQLISIALTDYQAMANKFGQVLQNLSPLATFHPIRVKTTKLLGVWKILSYADVSGVVVRSRTSFRRSRQPEG